MIGVEDLSFYEEEMKVELEGCYEVQPSHWKSDSRGPFSHSV